MMMGRAPPLTAGGARYADELGTLAPDGRGVRVPLYSSAKQPAHHSPGFSLIHSTATTMCAVVCVHTHIRKFERVKSYRPKPHVFGFNCFRSPGCSVPSGAILSGTGCGDQAQTAAGHSWRIKYRIQFVLSLEIQSIRRIT